MDNGELAAILRDDTNRRLEGGARCRGEVDTGHDPFVGTDVSLASQQHAAR
jgi:hypothetical protein